MATGSPGRCVWRLLLQFVEDSLSVAGLACAVAGHRGDNRGLGAHGRGEREARPAQHSHQEVRQAFPRAGEWGRPPLAGEAQQLLASDTGGWLRSCASS